MRRVSAASTGSKRPARLTRLKRATRCPRRSPFVPRPLCAPTNKLIYLQNKPNAAPPPSDEEPLVGVTAPCTAEDLAELKVKELKSLARQWGVNTADCFERTDIVNKLVSFDPEAGLPAMVVEEPKVEVKAAVVKEEDVGVRISADSDDLD